MEKEGDVGVNVEGKPEVAADQTSVGEEEEGDEVAEEEEGDEVAAGKGTAA